MSFVPKQGKMRLTLELGTPIERNIAYSGVDYVGAYLVWCHSYGNSPSKVAFQIAFQGKAGVIIDHLNINRYCITQACAFHKKASFT
jgi:hypothetical protein